MRVINITPLLMDHKKELVTDLLWLKQNCGISDVGFSMTLHPEGAVPNLDKARYLRDCFVDFKQDLIGSGLRVGILMQSTIGHGYAPEANQFQKIVSLDGTETFCVCPLDKDFQSHMREVSKVISKAHPDFILVDDDFRLIHGRNGCFCPLHLEFFSKKTGKHYDRETLLQILQKTDAYNKQIGDLWNACLSDSLVSAAREIRSGIDSVDPNISCGYCDCSADIQFAKPIAKALQGNKLSLVRINNARYLETERGTADFPKRMSHAAFQIKYLQGIDDILGESDTCPHNRFSTSAKGLLSHITGSLLSGCNGIKLWITRTGAYEPESGKAYREMLKANRNFLMELFKLIPQIKWQGPVCPLPTAPLSNWNPPLGIRQETIVNWGSHIFGNMGIPVSYGVDNNNQPVMLCGDDVDYLTDDELNILVSRQLLLDGNAAEKMCRRGFSHYLGVIVEPGHGHPVRMWEKYYNVLPDINNNNKKITMLADMKKICPLNKAVQVLSEAFCCPWSLCQNMSKFGAGQTLFENALHGRVAIFAQSIAKSVMGNATFLNETRKSQLINILDWLNGTPVEGIITGDSHAYTQYGIISSENETAGILCLINLGFDIIQHIGVRISASKIRNIYRLDENGSWEKLEWEVKSDTEIAIETQVETMAFAIIKLQFKS